MIIYIVVALAYEADVLFYYETGYCGPQPTPKQNNRFQYIIYIKSLKARILLCVVIIQGSRKHKLFSLMGMLLISD